MAKISKDDVLSYLEGANMLEISELISDIEEKFGVSAAAPVAVAGVAAPAAGDAGAAGTGTIQSHTPELPFGTTVSVAYNTNLEDNQGCTL